MKLKIPELSLVVLIGPSGSGKSTFGRKHFLPTEILSSDFCRGLVSDDENNQAATNAAFEVLHYIAGKRLAAGKLTVIDATNVQAEARKPLVALARDYHCLPVAIVLDLPERLCQDRNRGRSERTFGPHVIRQQSQQLRKSLRNLQVEGFRHVHVLASPEEIDAATIEREPLWNNRKSDHGPFDIIGDIHGCFDETKALLERLGYVVDVTTTGERTIAAKPPGNRKAVFVGDLVDRGPNTPDVLRLVMGMVEAGTALCVPGNHDVKLLRKLRGKDVQITHGLAESLAQLDREPAAFREKTAAFIDDLVSHYVLDDNGLVVAHAGMKETMQGRGSGKVREFALYGETTGETDEFGLPVRNNWAAEYRGPSMVVYGHTPVPAPEWLNNTINIDTGCVFGGKLTALRYPEKELVSVPAGAMYAKPAKPFHPAEFQTQALSPQQAHDDLLDLADVIGKRIVTTRLHHNVTIREENAIAALEVMSRFAANPKWLIYLPPTMSPPETSQEGSLLEHPAQAFAYFRHEGIPQVLCEEKHMGSRVVVVLCRNEDAARRRFGIVSESGICVTRTGRRFFEDLAFETELLAHLREALDRSESWKEFDTDWVCLDCELMPWSAKAQELVKRQYAAVGAASGAALRDSVETLKTAAARGADVASLLERSVERASLAEKYVTAYRGYCWPVKTLADIKLAPFHVLATEGKTYFDKNHLWHMSAISRFCKGSKILIETGFIEVNVTDEASEQAGIRWWEELTSRGGEGMVVKPLDFVARGRRGVAQPAVKCRGPEYLRIIYGPDYSIPANLSRLRSRGLGAKRSLAMREFALGVEGLERFVRNEPLRRVHECVFGVLALESEPVDPRL
ncbi:MAG: polynucleotide kinase-phosphatase [Planctomycetes bacterium]|nr:polynucleotide kinase-phosphatase [Planctomycetota bacterium]